MSAVGQVVTEKEKRENGEQDVMNDTALCTDGYRWRIQDLKHSVRITATFGITGADEALPSHFTCQPATERPRVK